MLFKKRIVNICFSAFHAHLHFSHETHCNNDNISLRSMCGLYIRMKPFELREFEIKLHPKCRFTL